MNMRWKATLAAVIVVPAAAVFLAGSATAPNAKTAAPVVVTLAASGVTATSATFNATVNPNGLATTVWFQWQPADGDTNTARAIGVGTSPVPVSVTITGLKPGTAYKYQVAAWNSKGTKLGALTPFTTAVTDPPPPPTKTVYLTFDDGPTAGYTNEVLADLTAAGAHATFFEIGQSTYTASGMCPGTASYNSCLTSAGNAGLVRALLAAGNQIGTHSWDHPDFTSLSAAQTATEVSRARNLQIAITGQDSKLFRYPYNFATAAGANYLASQGIQAVGADIDPSDWNWQLVTDTDVITAVMTQVHNGAVVQLHDGQDVLGRDGGHPGYLPGLLTQLKAAGYTFGTLTNGGNYPRQIAGIGKRSES